MTRRARREAQEESDTSHFPLAEIRTASENDRIYDPFAVGDGDDWKLIQSIKEHGIQEPLCLSADHVLLSGHRRLAAARFLNLTGVPVRFVDVVFEGLSTRERLEVLRRFNQQREKTPAEKIREALVDVDPKVAYVQLLQRREQLRRRLADTKINVELGAYKGRARITTLGFLDAVKKIVDENKAYWPLTDRRIHYLLLNEPPLRHDRKKHSRYANDHASYKALTHLLTRARLVGEVDLNAIEDPTRPVQTACGFSSLDEFVTQETEGFLTGYWRDLMQGQPHHVEIMLEKNALRTVVEEVARAYRIPVVTGRGFSSLAPRIGVMERFRQSGKKTLVLLMLTDFDPDGEQIAASFARSMRDDFGIFSIHPVKVCLTSEDVEREDLPSDMDAKPSSPNYRKFVERYGRKAVELDAAPVGFLQQKLRDAIEGVLDIEVFNAQLAQEVQDAAHIDARRKVVMDAIGSALGGDGPW